MSIYTEFSVGEFLDEVRFYI